MEIKMKGVIILGEIDSKVNLLCTSQRKKKPNYGLYFNK